MSGWIKLKRRMMEWEWYDDSHTVHLFIHLILKANREPGEWRGVKVGIGQLITGRKKLAEQTGMSERNVRTALKHLEISNEVTIKATKKYSIITVTNWQEHQTGDQQTDQQSDHQSDHKQEVNKLINNLSISTPTKGATSLGTDWTPTAGHVELGTGEGYTADEVNWLSDGFRDYWHGEGKRKKDWGRTFANHLRSEIAHRRIDQRRKSLGGKSNNPGFAELAGEVVRDLQRHGEPQADAVHGDGGYSGGAGCVVEFDATSGPEHACFGVVEIGGGHQTAAARDPGHEIHDSCLSGRPHECAGGLGAVRNSAVEESASGQGNVVPFVGRIAGFD